MIAREFLHSRIFRTWLVLVLAAWAVLSWSLTDVAFAVEHWYYPAVMVVGAFVAGSTPEGGGAVAFPVLSVFLSIDRGLARDFSLMIQSVGMTSASLFVLTRPGVDRSVFRPLCWWIPVAFAGFVLGMATVQGLRVPIIQALFLSLIAAFSVAYLCSDHRGVHDRLPAWHRGEFVAQLLVLLAGGMCASLFGTGADILLYTLLVTQFALKEKQATELSIVLMAALSVLGSLWRWLVQGELTRFQVQTWLLAAPVVLFMAPLGSLVLRRVPGEWLLRAVVGLNVGQLLWFNVNRPTGEKFWWSLGFSACLFAGFCALMLRLARRRRSAALLSS
ncbi:MAG: sulfite exporter TauE/SafE family protein [Planctomycetes bacterium]|nr:sulfite exporter TauE/SafE family protein [Planctomycetota bacterium]